MTKGELNKFFESFEDETELYVEEEDNDIFPAGVRYEMSPNGEGKLVFIAYPIARGSK